MCIRDRIRDWEHFFLHSILNHVLSQVLVESNEGNRWLFVLDVNPTNFCACASCTSLWFLLFWLDSIWSKLSCVQWSFVFHLHRMFVEEIHIGLPILLHDCRIANIGSRDLFTNASMTEHRLIWIASTPSSCIFSVFVLDNSTRLAWVIGQHHRMGCQPKLSLLPSQNASDGKWENCQSAKQQLESFAWSQQSWSVAVSSWEHDHSNHRESKKCHNKGTALMTTSKLRDETKTEQTRMGSKSEHFQNCVLCLMNLMWATDVLSHMWKTWKCVWISAEAVLNTALHVWRPMAGHLSLIHIWRCRRYAVCRSRWSPYH